MTNTALALPGWTHVYSGKVRDLYRPATDDAAVSETVEGRMLVVASDRVSAFDFVLSPAIPGKGELLTTLSLWWFDQLAGADGGRRIPNHLAASHTLAGDLIPAEVAGRAMVVRSLDMLPIECVVRGYLTGSGFKRYQVSGTVCGIPLPAGLADGERLPEPIFTPAYKAPMGEHDENISFAQTEELVGAERAAELRDVSLEIYRRAAATAEAAGLILADTKFEFGLDADGVLTLADEVLTSDSSRYWDAAAWASGTTPAERMASFDKQIVRDWLAANWAHAPGGSAQRDSDASRGRGEAHEGTPPELPAEIVARTADKYRALLEKLTA